MRLVCALVTLLAAFAPLQAAAADNDATVAVSVRVEARTSLHVSTGMLQFVVAEGATTAIASVEFNAAARVAHGDAVVLSVEPTRAVGRPGAAADVKTAITFSGDGDGTQSGTLASGISVAGKWQGSGQRTGRLLFTLHASAPGVYTVPVRLALTTR